MVGEGSDWEGAKGIGRWPRGHKGTEPTPKDRLMLRSQDPLFGWRGEAAGRSLRWASRSLCSVGTSLWSLVVAERAPTEPSA